MEMFESYILEQSISDASCCDIEEASFAAEYEVISALANAYIKQIKMQTVLEGVEIANPTDAALPATTTKSNLLEKIKKFFKTIGGYILGVVNKIAGKLSSTKGIDEEASSESFISNLKKLASKVKSDENVRDAVASIKDRVMKTDINELIKSVQPKRVMELSNRFSKIENCLNQIKNGVSDTGDVEVGTLEEPESEEKTFDSLTIEAIMYYFSQFKDYTKKLRSIKWRELQSDIKQALVDIEKKIDELQNSSSPDQEAIAKLNKTLSTLKSMQKDIAELGSEIIRNLNMGPKLMKECKGAFSQAFGKVADTAKEVGKEAINKVVDTAKEAGSEAIKNSYDSILNVGNNEDI
jgi:hypothetical protein